MCIKKKIKKFSGWPKLSSLTETIAKLPKLSSLTEAIAKLYSLVALLQLKYRLRHPEKCLLSLSIKYIFWIKVSEKKLFLFENRSTTTHCCCICLTLAVIVFEPIHRSGHPGNDSIFIIRMKMSRFKVSRRCLFNSILKTKSLVTGREFIGGDPLVRSPQKLFCFNMLIQGLRESCNIHSQTI